MKTVAILATIDTKGQETIFLKNRIQSHGCAVTVVDCSLRAGGGRDADVQVEDLLRVTGTDEQSFALYDKDGAIASMQKALRIQLLDMHKKGLLDGVISVGGVQGTIIATAAMQALPVGVPKFMVSTVANGNATFGPFVGVSDMVIMHSVVDIAGLNYVLRKVLTEAAGAISGMVKALSAEKSSGNVVGITMAGVTTPCVTQVQKALEDKGYEVLIVHCNGVGAHILENLVAEGDVSYVLDISPHDIMDGLYDGLMPCYEDRLRPVVKAGVPLLFVPGGLDFILYNGVDKVPPHKQHSAYYKHNQIHTHVRADYDEMYRAGRFVAQRLAGAQGNACILVPKRGYSQMNQAGKPLYDPGADAGFVDAVTQHQPPHLTVQCVDAHINDPAFAEACVQQFEAMAAQRAPAAAQHVPASE